jgi:urease accessory protein
MATTTSIIMTTDAALYRLMTWLSPAYPVGGFSYSHGLEYAVEAGQVRTADDLGAWIATVLERGAGPVDAALFAAAWRAADAGDDATLDDLIELGMAWRGTAETALESAAQGAAFVAITTATWPDAVLGCVAGRHDGRLPFAVAVAVAAAAQGIALEPALMAYLQAFAANLVSAGVRLVPLGQTDGQRVIARLEPVVLCAARTAIKADLDELGTAAPLLDWCSMKHETQYTRLFRS